MSPQNIAIVMSPNLLWSPETSDIDYVSKVNSTASVNTIVEALVSDWSYFFGDEFTVSDFYVTFSRDELFPHNGGFPVDRDFHTENIMTKSMNIVSGSNDLNSNTNINSTFGSGYQTHSRSSSHDTSLVLLESGTTVGNNDSLIKRSQSNSSLSDSSPPQQGSPKLPLRRKHNKQVAPTPPDNRFQRSSEHYSSISSQHFDSTLMKERFMNTNPHDVDDLTNQSCRLIKNEVKAQQSTATNTNLFKPPHPVSLRQRHGSTENLSSKPDKPPRPAMPVIESQTLIRNAFKNKVSDRLDRHVRPIALPRNILNVARSTENLSTAGSPSPVKNIPGSVSAQHRIDCDDQDLAIMLRDSASEHNRPDKPAIPERPISLMKSNFRTAVFDKFDTNQTLPNHSPQSDQCGSGIKKTQSFRLSSSPANGQKGTAVGSITGRSLTTLERTHIYNVDKQQVEIIDVSDQQNNTGGSQNLPKSTASVNGDKDAVTGIDEIKQKECGQLSCSVEANAIVDNVPQSPRCFEPKVIKRPQIPAPPPPKLLPNTAVDTNQENEQHPNRKSTGIAADSTNL